MSGGRWYVLDVNPEQWRVGPLSVGRKAGRVWPYIGRDQQLHAYQEAVREILEEKEPEIIRGEVAVTLVFWRQMEQYKTESSRKQRRNQADLTNLQKAVEDAVQGVLIENDRDVREMHTHVAEQDYDTVPCVVIKIEPWQGFDPAILPDFVWMEVDFVRSPDDPHPQQLEIG